MTNDMIQWLHTHGGFVHPALKFVYTEERGVHLLFRTSNGIGPSKIETGTVAISCPHNITLSALNARGIPLAFNDPATQRNKDPSGESQSNASSSNFSNLSLPQEIRNAPIRPQCLAAIYLCIQLSLGNDSFWTGYIDSLPEPVDSPEELNEVRDEASNILDLPLSWSETEKSWVEGSPLSKGIKDLEAIWKAEYDVLFPRLTDWSEEHDIDLSWNRFKWALSILSSRAFPSWLLRGVPLNPTQPTSASLQPFTYDADVLLYPGIDALNHSSTTRNYWISNEYSFSIVIEDEVKPGGEIFNSYGGKNNGQLLLSYGFALQENEFDAFPLKMPAREYEFLEYFEESAERIYGEETSGEASGELESSGKALKQREASEMAEQESSKREPLRIREANDPSNTTFY
ncbi:MAG: hypothetical protein Q9159_001185 [Coniocarpon cinnabarinum]